ncbi:hypothetical protein ACLBR5_20220 [Escherichia coli]
MMDVIRHHRPITSLGKPELKRLPCWKRCKSRMPWKLCRAIPFNFRWYAPAGNGSALLLRAAIDYCRRTDYGAGRHGAVAGTAFA